jgi:hypothetical protein
LAMLGFIFYMYLPTVADLSGAPSRRTVCLPQMGFPNPLTVLRMRIMMRWDIAIGAWRWVGAPRLRTRIADASGCL